MESPEAELARPLNPENGPQNKAQWANERLETILGYGRFQKFQVWVFVGLVSFIGAMNYFQLMFLVTKSSHRCALPEKIESQ